MVNGALLRTVGSASSAKGVLSEVMLPLFVVPSHVWSSGVMKHVLTPCLFVRVFVVLFVESVSTPSPPSEIAMRPSGKCRESTALPDASRATLTATLTATVPLAALDADHHRHSSSTGSPPIVRVFFALEMPGATSSVFSSGPGEMLSKADSDGLLDELLERNATE